MEKEEKVDRRKGGKTIPTRGQGWTLAAENRTRWKGFDVKSSVWPQNDLARLWDRLN